MITTPKRQGPPALLNVAQTAERLGVSRWTLHRWLREGCCPIPTVQIGGQRRFTEAQVSAFLSGVSTAELLEARLRAGEETPSPDGRNSRHNGGNRGEGREHKVGER